MTATDPAQEPRLLHVFLAPDLAGDACADSALGPAVETDPSAAALPYDPEDPRLRLRLFIGGRLADEAWLDTTDPDAQRLADITTAVHSEGVDLAIANGLPWLVEVYDPAQPPDAAYYRVGSDTAGMVCPVALDLVVGREN